jgi:hypothetical protein
MQATHEAGAFAYETGEEVVARTAGVDAFDVERCAPVPAACMPPWTIGRIVARVRHAGRPAYVLRFGHHGSACLCFVGEDAVEGTA